jgi:TolA-binding protein
MTMNKTLAIILGLVLFCATATAEDKKDTGFWGELRSKVEGLAPKKKTAEITAVGGVRGAKDSTTEGLYWKGEDKKIEIADDEMTAFRAALEEAVAGKRDEAAAKFDRFAQVYPKSILKDDARRALEELMAGK